MNKPLVKLSIRAENERTILEAAEAVFAEQGFGGATTAAIATRAGVPKANLHYYFSTKAALYRAVIERVLTAWLAAASCFDESDDPREALSRYIGAKMDLARSMPLGSQIWASEIMRGAPVIQDFLETTLADWVESRGRVVRRWIGEGRMRPIEPRYLFYMIWATTQHYADFDAQIRALKGKRALTQKAFEVTTEEVVQLVIRACGAVSPAQGKGSGGQ